MKTLKLILPLAAAAAFLATTGCAPRPVYVAGPPPPPGAVPPLIERADHEGFSAGSEDGARDAGNGFGYHPRHDARFSRTPGYDPNLGPYPPYRDAFRRAYLRGYDAGFYHRAG
jgi:ribosome modulation factor